jgi:uncharacterized damage-inducible protein DinB
MSTTAIDFIKRGLDFAHNALADARNGTDEQLHFVPPNGPHSIAWCLWHTARVEDLIVNGRILGRPPIWNEDWARRTGLPAEGLGVGQANDEAQQVRIADVAAFAAYQDAVWASSNEFLAGATDADLAREVPTRTGTESVGEAISLHLIGHFNGHRGEINLLRGLQGMPPLLASIGTH